MKQCIKCLSDNVSTIVDKSHVFYKCNNCGSVNARVQNTSGAIITKIESGLVKHVSVIVLIKKRDKILLINRRHFPFGFCFPSGHVRYGETPVRALERELLEETGLSVKNKKLIFHDTIPDKCKFGADLHELYLYECKTTGDLVLNHEGNDFIWADIKKLEGLNIIPQAKIVLNRIGLLGKISDQMEEQPTINTAISRAKTAAEGAIENLPIAVMLLDQKGKIRFSNKSASALMENFQDSGENRKLIAEIERLGFKSAKTGTEFSHKITLDNKTYSLTFNPLNLKKSRSATVTIKNVSGEHEQDMKDDISYQISLTSYGSPNSFGVIKTVFKQLMLSFNIDGINLMLSEQDKFKSSLHYGNTFKKNTKINEIAECVALSKHILAVPDTSKDDRFSGKNEKPFSLLALPVISNKNVIGVLNVIRPKNNYFNEDEVNMVSIVANRIALSLEKDRLYKSFAQEKKTLEKVLGTTTDGFIMVDKNYNLIFANDAAIKLLPLRQNDLKNNTVNDYLSELSQDNSKKLRHYVQESIKRKKRFEIEFISHKGLDKVVIARFNPVIEKNGNCGSVLVGFTNTTKLANKQKTVKKQVKQLTALFKISSLSMNSTSLFFNNVLKRTAAILDSAASDLFFVNQDDNLTGLPLEHNPEIISLLSQIKNRSGFEQNFICNNTKNHFDNITQISKIILTPIRHDGKVIAIMYSINKDKNYNSKDAKWHGIIAERLASRIETTRLISKLEKDRQQIEKIIDNSGDGIIVKNASDSKPIVWNKAMAQITGFKTSAQCRKVNTHIAQFVSDAQNEAAKSNLDRVYKELQYKNSDGEDQWLGVNLSLIRTGGNIDYVISNVRDISKDKKLEDRNKEFIYTTTHELRTPITAIKGYLSMILSGDTGKISPQQRKYFSRAYQSTENLVSLVEDLLKTAKIEEDKLMIVKEPFRLGKVAEEVAIDFSAKAKNKGIQFEAKPITGNVLVVGDMDKTKQALSNLVDNAIKYTTKGSVNIKIKKEKGFGKLVVEDTGVGIPKKEQEAVFTKFYRVPNAESVRAGGTGLGLFIVKNLVEKQGGEMQIESRLGKGTSISILLPLVSKENRC